MESFIKQMSGDINQINDKMEILVIKAKVTDKELERVLDIPI